MVVASPGFMTAIGVPEVDIFSLEYLFNSFDHWEKCLDGEFGDKMKEVVKEKTGNNFRTVSYTHLDVYKRQILKCLHPSGQKSIM